MPDIPAPSALEPFPLWESAAPLSLGNRSEDRPVLTPFSSPHAGPKSPALLVFPGGGYEILADYEGAGYAEWFAQFGIRTFVLRYRLGRDGYRHPAMLEDAARAVRLLRARSAELGIDPAQLGVIGSSAGGHLAATLMTHFTTGNPNATDPVERQSSRPDLGLLCYPVITFEGTFAQKDTVRNLLGENPPAHLLRELSAEQHITAETPPCFIWHTVEDEIVPVENCLLFASALRAAGVPFALHLFERGVHGLGLKQMSWGPEALEWLGLRWPIRR